MNPTIPIAKTIYELLAQSSGPVEGCQLIQGILANALGRIAEENWQAMLEQSKIPCSDPICDCHISKEKLFLGLDSVRNEFLKFNSRKQN